MCFWVLNTICYRLFDSNHKVWLVVSALTSPHIFLVWYNWNFCSGIMVLMKNWVSEMAIFHTKWYCSSKGSQPKSSFELFGDSSNTKSVDFGQGTTQVIKQMLEELMEWRILGHDSFVSFQICFWNSCVLTNPSNLVESARKGPIRQYCSIIQ